MNPQDLTFLIKTFERPGDCRKLIASIVAKYPGFPITVLDDSRAPKEFEHATTIKAEYDIGLSEGRNRLLDSVQTPYFMMLDDDYIFEGQSDVEKLLRVLDKGYEIVFGTINRKRCPQWSGNIEKRGKGIYITKDVRWHQSGTDHWADVHIAPNLYVGRKGTKVRYDPRWKTGAEHIDCAVKMRDAGLSCAFVPSVSVWHSRNRPKGYKNARARGLEFNKKWRAENGVTSINPLGTPMHNMPPIVVLTPGSTGSRLVTQFYAAQGWQCGDIDEYGEHPEFRRLNISMRGGDSPNLRAFIDKLPPRWILKDPRISREPRIFNLWRPLFMEQGAMLVLNMRNRDTHNASMKNRWGISAKESHERRASARNLYDSWEGLKTQLDYEQLQSIAELWRPA